MLIPQRTKCHMIQKQALKPGAKKKRIHENTQILVLFSFIRAVSVKTHAGPLFSSEFCMLATCLQQHCDDVAERGVVIDPAAADHSGRASNH